MNINEVMAKKPFVLLENAFFLTGLHTILKNCQMYNMSFAIESIERKGAENRKKKKKKKI